MKIFISWSGEKSKNIATYFKKWIEKIIQSADPWLSSANIDKGKNWNQEIVNNLEISKVGIICVTRDNLNAPWMLFEAGAISKSSDSYVCTFLVDLNPTDLTGPLAMFQATKFNKQDIFELLNTINKTIPTTGGKSLPQDTLKSLFDTFYPQFEKDINDILSKEQITDNEAVRTERQLLEEAIQILRTLKTDKPLNANTLLDHYIFKYANFYNIAPSEVGSPNYIDDLMSRIGDNPLLLDYFGSSDHLKSYIQSNYWDLPF